MGRALTSLRTRSVSWLALLAVGTGVLALGVLVGNTSTLGAKNLTVLTGEAILHNNRNWLTSFDTLDPDDQLAFYANAVAWSDESMRGDGKPPCLKLGRSVPVRVGYAWVTYADNASRPVVAWVECLG